jgi:hypothetical protein
MKSLANLNTFSAQPLAYDDQGTGAQTLANRYQINGLIDTADNVMTNIEKICSAAGSWLSYDIHEGQWGVVINTTGTSVASFNDTNILGNISVSGTGLTDLYNSVKVEFPHRDLRDSADFVTIEIPDEDRNANEEDNALNLTYDIINEPIQAQLLGFIELKQSRVDLVITFETDYSNFNVKAGDIIDVTNERFGFDSKLFRVITTSEIQDDLGAIRISITALEYEPNVYSVDDLYRFTRTDENGIITIGSIGVPGTPQVTKFERNSRPRIVVETTAPTGVVEGIEYWLTEDVNVFEDSLRSYRLIASVRPEGGGVFASGTQVTTEYDNLTNSDFVIKTRGFNSTVVGPFSTPSGIINFNPQQITDAIGPNTVSVDATGAILTAIATNLLIKELSDLFQGSVSSSSIFTKIFEIFEDVTGVDLVGQAEGGELVVASDLKIYDEGTEIANKPKILNFVGAAVTATVSGDVVNVVISGTGGGGDPGGGGVVGGVTVTSVQPAAGPTAGGTVVTIIGSGFTGATAVRFSGVDAEAFTVNSDTQITATTAAGPAGPGSVTVVSPSGSNITNSLYTYIEADGVLSIVALFPPDRQTFLDPLTDAQSDLAPITGPYYIKFGGRTFFGALTGGTGNAYLYKSDGTLVETLAGGDVTIDNNLVALTFADRQPGTDYYILLDPDFVKYCDTISPSVFLPTTWNFNTPLYSVPAYNFAGDVPSPAPVYNVVATGITPNSINTPFTANLSISWSTPTRQGSGNVYVRDSLTDVAALTFTAQQLALGQTALGSLEPGKQYYVTADAGVVESNFAGDCYSSAQSPSTAIVKADNLTFTMIDALLLVDFEVNDNPIGGDKVNPQTNVRLIFNRNVQFGDFGTITILSEGGATHQAFNIKSSFNFNKSSEIIWISNNVVNLNPTTDFSLGETYYVNITNSAVKDFFGLSYQGLTDDTTVRFSIDPGPTAATAPIDNDSSEIVLTFDREIEPGTGDITYKIGDTEVGSTDANDSSVSITTA